MGARLARSRSGPRGNTARGGSTSTAPDLASAPGHGTASDLPIDPGGTNRGLHRPGSGRYTARGRRDQLGPLGHERALASSHHRRSGRGVVLGRTGLERGRGGRRGPRRGDHQRNPGRAQSRLRTVVLLHRLRGVLRRAHPPLLRHPPVVTHQAPARRCGAGHRPPGPGARGDSAVHSPRRSGRPFAQFRFDARTSTPVHRVP